MKVIYVDILYDYGIESRGFNLIGQEGFLKNLINLGHTVYPFYFDEYLKSSDFDVLQNKLIDFVDKVKPDVIFHPTYSDQFYTATLDYLKSKYITVAWFGDDTWRFDSYTKNYASHYTYCVTTDKFSIDKYIDHGQKNIILSQWAAINVDKMPCVNNVYEFNVSFVGGCHPYREWFINELAEREIKVHTFGQGWENGTVSSDRMNEIFANSKINLNISNSACYDIRYIYPDYNKISAKSINLFKKIRELLQFKKIKKKFPEQYKNHEQVKARNFEIPYFNGFQLSYYHAGISDYFNIGKEIACFKNIEEAELLIKYYLKNTEERENIKKAGHLKALNKHDYKERLKKIFEHINNDKGKLL